MSNPTGQYNGRIRPYDVNGYLDEQCDLYPEYCSTDVVETLRATSLPEIVGYYNTLGQKLPQEPQSGIYIILYDNGETEKVVK